MSCNSAIYTVNSSQQEMLANSQVPFGTIVRRFGPYVNLEGAGITACKAGYYSIDCSITLLPTAAGEVSAQLYVNGEPYQGAYAAGYAQTAGNPVNLKITAMVRLRGCCESSATFGVWLGDEGATLSNMACKVEKI